MAAKQMQPPPPVRTKPQVPTENFITNAWDETVRYLKGVKAELGRVSWPSRQELRYNTIVVVIVVAGISLYMWSVDQAIGWIFRMFHRT